MAETSNQSFASHNVSQLRDRFREMRPLQEVLELYMGIPNRHCLEHQEILFRAVFSDPLVRKHPPSIRYQRSFLKALIYDVENCGKECYEELLIYYIGLPKTQPGDFFFQTYSFASGPSPVHASVKVTDAFGHAVGTGAQVWNAGLLLADIICACPTMLLNKRVLELGSGSGLVGVVAAKTAAPASLILTDYLSDVLDNICSNLQLNTIPVHARVDDSASIGSLFPLAEPHDAEGCPSTHSHAELPRVCVAHLDFTTVQSMDVSSLGLQVILASDVV
jgi:predicted nicotinamide N-methyase